MLIFQNAMNVDTLLEAARYIELQEEKERLQQLNKKNEMIATGTARSLPPLTNQLSDNMSLLIRNRQGKGCK